MNLNWTPFLPHQWRFFAFKPSAGPGAELTEDGLVVEKSALLGGWGSAKTHGLIRKAFALGCANPWTPAYGATNPSGIISAPTFKILMQSTMAQWDKLVPREAIRKRRGPPHNDILMANGFRWLLHSGQGEMEGNTSCVVVIDEIHHRSYASNPMLYMNGLARLRDENARRLAMLVAGLPEAGWVREMFDRSGPDRNTVLCATRSNPHIPKATLRSFYDDCPSGQEKTLLGDEWRSVDGAIYSQFDAALHLVDAEGRTDQVTHLGLDVGSRGAILFAQRLPVKVKTFDGQVVTENGLLIIDQVLTRDASVEEMAAIAKARPWPIVPGQSTICTDPTIRRDETNVLRRTFPGVKIVSLERGEEGFPVEDGIRQVQRALLDARRNVRLKFNRKLASTPLGVIDLIQRYRRNERTQEPIKDNSRDHVGDALRYLVCELIPSSRPKPKVLA